MFRADAPIWQLAFRPFFLLGAFYSLLVIALWLLFLSGGIGALGYLPPTIWHAHEMIYGFTSAIIAGFLLTAVQNWTGLRGVHGRKLQLLAVLWILGRLLLLGPPQARMLAAIVDLGFYPCVALLMVPYLRDPELKVERVLFGFFALFFGGNLLVHLESLGWIQGWARTGILLGLNTVTLLIVFIGGRVIPFFTESSVARKQPRTWKPVEVLSHVSAGAFVLSQFFFSATAAAAAIAFATAFIHFVRLTGWQVRRVRKVPLIWVLHLAYLWLIIGFAMTGLSALGYPVASSAIHAFTVGGLGAMIHGMIARVSLGHTGRRIHPSPWIGAAFYLLNIAAVVRVFVPWASPGAYSASLTVSGTLWIAAFGIFIVIYAPILFAPRVDGKPG